MNIVKNIDQYNEDHVYFLEPIKNNIMNNGNFIRIIYSTSLFILNGIYINISINYTSVDKYYNKYKCSFDINQYRDLIEKLRILEEGLIKKISILGKAPQFKIYEQLKNGNIKVFSETSDKIGNTFLLKICFISACVMVSKSSSWKRSSKIFMICSLYSRNIFLFSKTSLFLGAYCLSLKNILNDNKTVLRDVSLHPTSPRFFCLN